jgi:enamine deaminase RidA (YjgF/YER057c/UK114 family)
MPKRSVNPPELVPSVPHGFSQAVVSSGNTTVYVSGQVAWDAEKRIVGGTDVGSQARAAFANLRRALEASGGTLADVVMLRIYVVDYDAEKGKAIAATLQGVFPQEPPASSWIGVAALARPEFAVEIEATAVLE